MESTYPSPSPQVPHNLVTRVGQRRDLGWRKEGAGKEVGSEGESWDLSQGKIPSNSKSWDKMGKSEGIRKGQKGNSSALSMQGSFLGWVNIIWKIPSVAFLSTASNEVPSTVVLGASAKQTACLSELQFSCQ